uniref:Uncharacterized protein n=1 Tax=Strigamia maritima TaxID=126957 RepID=T1J4U7_STRMM
MPIKLIPNKNVYYTRVEYRTKFEIAPEDDNEQSIIGTSADQCHSSATLGSKLCKPFAFALIFFKFHSTRRQHGRTLKRTQCRGIIYPGPRPAHIWAPPLLLYEGWCLMRRTCELTSSGVRVAKWTEVKKIMQFFLLRIHSEWWQHCQHCPKISL